MASYSYGIEDFRHIATGAAILASGGGGSYHDALDILDQLAVSDWNGEVRVQAYDGATPCCVLAMMGSPDAADNLTLSDIAFSITNTINAYQTMTGSVLGCVIPVEVGAINSIVPLIAATLPGSEIQWVVNGDGAGRAVPELPQTTYSGAANLAESPCVLANDARATSELQASLLYASTAGKVEALAGGIVAAFGSFSGIALWPSNAGNDFALTDNYIPDTLEQARQLGQYLWTASTTPSTADVVAQIEQITGRSASAVVTNFYVTDVTQSTTKASLDTGVIRLDNQPDPAQSTATHYIYNLNENLIMYSAQSVAADIIAPDSICYYSESTGHGFSNATDDLAPFFDMSNGKSTGQAMSVIAIEALPAFRQAPGVVNSFAELLRNIGYAGAVPYAD